MLTQIRERATGWIAWAIVILITIPFALWGINSYFEVAAELPVATVNGEEIDDNRYRQALDERRRAIRQTFGANLDMSFLDTPDFKRNVVEALVEDMLLLDDAQRQGYRIGDGQLITLIHSIPQFQKDGAFDKQTYVDVIRGAGYSEQAFEASQRQDRLLNQLRRAYNDSSIVTDAEIDLLLQLEAQRRQADYVVYRATDYTDSVVVTDEEIAAHYATNSERYRSPARMKVEYLELSVESLQDQVELTDEEVLQAYEDNKGKYTDPAEPKASHILLSLAKDAEESAEQETLAKATELVEQARGGADFAELAKNHSEDPGSRIKGGDLGVITPGAMVKAFEDAVFSMKEGEVSEPVRTNYGYHIIKLTSLVDAKIKPFEDVRDEVAAELKQRLAEEEYLEKAEDFRNLVYENSDSLEPAADQLGLQIKQSDWFTEVGGPGIASHQRVVETAFADDVLNQELNSDAVEAGIDSLVSVRRLDYEPSTVKPLEEVKEAIESELKQERAEIQAVASAKETLEKLQAGANWDNVIEENNDLTTVKLAELKKEAEAGEQQQVAEAVFAAPRPAEDKPTLGGVELPGTGYGLFRLTDVTDGDIDKMTEADRKRVEDQLRRRRGSDFFQSYREGLRQLADVQIYEERL